MDHITKEREREREKKCKKREKDIYIYIYTHRTRIPTMKAFLKSMAAFSRRHDSTLWPIEFSYPKLGRNWEIWKRVSTKAASKIRVEPGRAYTVVNEKRHCFVPRFSVVPPIPLPLPLPLPLDFNESFDELADSDAQREYRFLEFVKLSSRNGGREGGGGCFRWLFTTGEKKVVGGGQWHRKLGLTSRSLWRKSANWIFGVSPHHHSKTSCRIRDYPRQ